MPLREGAYRTLRLQINTSLRAWPAKQSAKFGRSGGHCSKDVMYSLLHTTPPDNINSCHRIDSKKLGFRVHSTTH